MIMSPIPGALVRLAAFRPALCLRIPVAAVLIQLPGSVALADDQVTPTIRFIGKPYGASAPGASSETATTQPLISLSLGTAEVELLLEKLEQQSGARISAQGKVPGQQVDSFSIRNSTLDEALRKLADSRNWVLHQPATPNTYELWDEESFKRIMRPRLQRERVFRVKNISAEEGAKAVAGVLTPDMGGAVFDSRANKVIVHDVPYVLDLAGRLLEQIDVAYVTRVFTVAHADTEHLSKILKSVKSSAAPDPIADNRTRQIIVEDRLEKIRKMEILVQTLDIATSPALSGTRDR